MDNTLNVLVSGCGGDIGQSVGKILKETNFLGSVLGADISLDHAGIFIFDECLLLPRCDDDGYIGSLKQLLKSHKIDILIPVSEAEIRFFHEGGLSEEELNIKVIMANKEALTIGLDKLKTSKFLMENHLPFPETSTLKSNEKISFPCIIKSRVGAGSKNVFFVKDEAELNYLRSKFPEFIAQEYLDRDLEEYTCGLFRSSKGEIRAVIFKRKLIGGFSGFGEVSNDLSINNLLHTLADKIQLRGSINVQLRMSFKGPVIFEINPRFSSTVRFRDLFGFNDVIWSLQDKLGQPIGSYSPIAEGRKFYKGFNEYIS